MPERVLQRARAHGAAVRLLPQRDDLGHPRDTQRGVALPAKHPLCVRVDRQADSEAGAHRQEQPGHLHVQLLHSRQEQPGHHDRRRAEAPHA